MTTVQEITDDPECRAATAAYNNHKRVQIELERKIAEEKKDAERQALREELMNAYKDQPWRDFFVTYNSQDFSNRVSTVGGGYPISLEILEIKNKEAREEIGKIEYSELREQEDQYCQQDRRRVSACTIYNEVLENQDNNIVEQFTEDYPELKETYNQCLTKINSLPKENDRNFIQSRNEIVQSYPCDLALEAAMQLRLTYSYLHPLK